jgi:hypothetical protein
MKTDGTQRLGYWLSLWLLLLTVVYFGLLVAALAIAGMPPIEPFNTLIGIVVLLTAPSMILLWAVIHQVAPADKRAFSLASLALMAVFATSTSINRYNALTVVPQATAMGKLDGLDWYMPYGWPSIMLAMEVLSWGYYYGLACLCLAPVFRKGRTERAVFWTLIAIGVLSLATALGQVLDSLALGLMGPLAWGPGGILLSALWMRWFRRRGGVVSPIRR